MPLIEVSAELDCMLPAPVRIPVPKDAKLPAGPLRLREENGTGTAPAQTDGEGVVALVSGMRAGQKKRYHLEKGEAGPGVTLKEEGEHALALLLPEGQFSVYNFDPAAARPFFYPVNGPGGKPMTRNYPMKDLPEEKAA